VAGSVEYTLGIDLGTSGCKVLALDVGGRLLATAEVRYPMVVPRPGWAEQHPRSWWRAAARGVRSLLARLPPGATAIGVGVTGQMHSLVALDSRRRVIRPAILCALALGLPAGIPVVAGGGDQAVAYAAEATGPG
jgi:xylulokinase